MVERNNNREYKVNIYCYFIGFPLWGIAPLYRGNRYNTNNLTGEFLNFPLSLDKFIGPSHKPNAHMSSPDSVSFFPVSYVVSHVIVK